MFTEHGEFCCSLWEPTIITILGFADQMLKWLGLSCCLNCKAIRTWEVDNPRNIAVCFDKCKCNPKYCVDGKS